VKYTVTLSFIEEADSPSTAVMQAFQDMCHLVANPCKGQNVTLVEWTKEDTGESVSESMTLDEGIIKTSPMRLAQILGFSHILWAGRHH
jgi:hypothetical protein